jgi:hypothetical protein
MFITCQKSSCIDLAQQLYLPSFFDNCVHGNEKPSHTFVKKRLACIFIFEVSIFSQPNLLVATPE